MASISFFKSWTPYDISVFKNGSNERLKSLLNDLQLICKNERLNKPVCIIPAFYSDSQISYTCFHAFFQAWVSLKRILSEFY